MSRHDIDEWLAKDEYEEEELKPILRPDRFQEWSDAEIQKLRYQVLDYIKERERLGYPPPKAIDIAWWYGGDHKQGLYVVPHVTMSEFLYSLPELKYNEEDGTYESLHAERAQEKA